MLRAYLILNRLLCVHVVMSSNRPRRCPSTGLDSGSNEVNFMGRGKYLADAFELLVALWTVKTQLKLLAVLRR